MATTSKWSNKDPADIADYYFDWTSFLSVDEVITTATVVAGTGLTTSGAVSHTDKVVRVRLAGGSDGASYPVTCLITTDAGQTFEMTANLLVKERIK